MGVFSSVVLEIKWGIPFLGFVPGCETRWKWLKMGEKWVALLFVTRCHACQTLEGAFKWVSALLKG